MQSILKDHGITRVLAEEGGRTSRGSLGNASDYVGFLNVLHLEMETDLPVIENGGLPAFRITSAANPLR